MSFITLKMENFQCFLLIFFLKTLMVGACKNRLVEVVLISTHNLCFGSKNKKKMYSGLFLYTKLGPVSGTKFFPNWLKKFPIDLEHSQLSEKSQFKR